jgi:hypothetical protein
MSHERNKFIRCCEPNCFAARYCLGRCLAHYREMDPNEVKRLQSINKKARAKEFQQMIAHPPRQKWTYENFEGETELAAMVEKQEQHKSQERNNG